MDARCCARDPWRLFFDTVIDCSAATRHGDLWTAKGARGRMRREYGMTGGQEDRSRQENPECEEEHVIGKKTRLGNTIQGPSGEDNPPPGKASHRPEANIA